MENTLYKFHGGGSLTKIKNCIYFGKPSYCVWLYNLAKYLKTEKNLLASEEEIHTFVNKFATATELTERVLYGSFIDLWEKIKEMYKNLNELYFKQNNITFENVEEFENVITSSYQETQSFKYFIKDVHRDEYSETFDDMLIIASMREIASRRIDKIENEYENVEWVQSEVYTDEVLLEFARQVHIFN